MSDLVYAPFLIVQNLYKHCELRNLTILKEHSQSSLVTKLTSDAYYDIYATVNGDGIDNKNVVCFVILMGKYTKHSPDLRQLINNKILLLNKNIVELKLIIDDVFQSKSNMMNSIVEFRDTHKNITFDTINDYVFYYDLSNLKYTFKHEILTPEESKLIL